MIDRKALKTVLKIADRALMKNNKPYIYENPLREKILLSSYSKEYKNREVDLIQALSFLVNNDYFNVLMENNGHADGNYRIRGLSDKGRYYILSFFSLDRHGKWLVTFIISIAALVLSIASMVMQFK